MTTQNRKARSLGRAGAAAFLFFLAASLLLAISPDGRQPRRWRDLRERESRIMDVFAQNYGGADWSLVMDELSTRPEDPANPAFMSVPLSLANVYLNRYEIGRDTADLEQSLHIFEWVAANRGLWGGRDGTGSVVSYLDISVSRLLAECDIGGSEARIDALWRTAMAITAEEAQALLGGGEGPDRPCHPTLELLGACVLAILPFPAEEEARASQAALFAAASSFLADDPHAPAWAQSARQLAVRAPAFACPAAETALALSQGALSFRLAGGDAPAEFDAGSGGGCPPFRPTYEAAAPVDVVTPGDSLATAIRDSRVVAFHLSELLWQFPPGSQCNADDEEEFTPREPVY